MNSKGLSVFPKALSLFVLLSLPQSWPSPAGDEQASAAKFASSTHAFFHSSLLIPDWRSISVKRASDISPV
jgi:hypothetical protein